MSAAPSTAAWRARGTFRQLRGHRLFTLDVTASGTPRHEPLLIIHGFPTSSYDFSKVLDRLSAHRRVLLIDLLGYGFSDKPDLAYTLDLEADLVSAFTDELGLDELALLTHDLGDSVGGELLARQLEGRWRPTVTRRVLTNGSIYIEMAQLNPGQQLLLGLPDERLSAEAPIDATSLRASLASTFSPAATVDQAEVAAQAELVIENEGHLILPRLIRYIEERRRNERRFTGAIEAHPSALHVLWGADDPIAVLAMTDRLLEARPDATLRVLDGVGHYPMVEDPTRFADSVAGFLD